MKSNKVRSEFLSFFKKKNHKVVKSAPMVIKNDPTLMFTNAGMNQFKDNFLGNVISDNKRIVDTQKCLRVSGKHNDLDEVGIDTYHHTMFEMLGNWSFGDYFKKEAINWAWELLTETYKIDKESLYITIFEGSKKDDTSKDLDAYNIWKEIIDESRIILGNKDDNFWEMGDHGPCGPCSEIHIDIRSEKEKSKTSGRDLVNKDHPEVIEIWNLVFIEFNRKMNGSLEKLPLKHIDTGMGFERLCMVLQGVKSNYDTDIFQPLIKELELVSKIKYGFDKEKDIAIRVIVDHLRAVSFSIADGQLPSNNGAGYVIRRILRRAIRYGYTFLDQKSPFIYKLVKKLSFQLSEAYPELESQIQIIENVIKKEESSFLITLEKGMIKLNEIILNNKTKKISGSNAFELYDTFGFPIDLTSLILRENGMSFDSKEFNSLMSIQKNRSKSAFHSSNEEWVKIHESEQTKFIGYDELNSNSKILRYRKTKNKKNEEIYQVVFDRTPFYPEGGGQVGDTGFLEMGSDQKIKILNTIKENDSIIHLMDSLPKKFDKNFNIRVDKNKRFASSSNHTATHLLHQALRNILGDHVQQKGSMVSDKYLRFDFSHFSRLNRKELEEVQNFVNQRIIDELALEENRNSSLKECIDNGVIALFGEKYGDVVRSVKFGKSYELCGGTHVKNTSQIRSFIITSESAISTGIRRIEALSGIKAINFLMNQTKTLKEINSILLNDKNPVDALNKIKNQNISSNKKLERTNNELIGYYIKDLHQNLELINNLNFCAIEFSCDPNVLKNLAFKAGKEIENLFLVLCSNFEGKAYVMCYISKNLTKSHNLNAQNIVQKLGDFIGGTGGGQSFFATATGNDISGIKNVIKKSRGFIN
ncbi:MAG: alanine--tRNA ligase [Flavobacteriaceae bacterium]|jgi:alanyl-tRNA synthetase|nr:alanine--tRNA ligase [Flavobacteriaceae bacterium]